MDHERTTNAADTTTISARTLRCVGLQLAEGKTPQNPPAVGTPSVTPPVALKKVKPSAWHPAIVSRLTAEQD
jgi:hypothetical protein